MLMMSPSLSHYSLEGEQCVRERGELAVWLVKVARIRACLKAGLSDHLDQQNASQKKKKKDQLYMAFAC